MTKTRNQIVAERMPLIEAFARGEVIQCMNPGGQWRDWNDPHWTSSTAQLRIKPKPREYWIDPEKRQVVQHLFPGVIHVREVED